VVIPVMVGLYRPPALAAKAGETISMFSDGSMVPKARSFAQQTAPHVAIGKLASMGYLACTTEWGMRKKLAQAVYG